MSSSCEKLSNIAYSNIPNDIKDVVNKLLKSKEMIEVIERCSIEMNLSFEEKCNSCCNSFDIQTVFNTNGICDMYVIFDILEPTTTYIERPIIYNVAAKITKDDENLKLIYVRNKFDKFSTSRAFVEKYFSPWFAQDVYIHVLDEISEYSSNLVKRIVKDIVPRDAETNYLNNFKDTINSEELFTIQTLRILGQERSIQVRDTYRSQKTEQLVLAKSFR